MKWFLFGACLILGAVTAAQWWLWPEQPPKARQTTHAGAPEQGAEQSLPNSIPRYRLPPQSVYQEIDKRPLFTSGRRPLAPVSAGKSKQAMADEPLPAHLGLTAILQTPDGALAMIEDRKEKQILRVEQGADIGGWEIVNILPDRLVLSQGEKRQEMLLREFHNVPPAATDQPAATSRPPGTRKAPSKKALPNKGTPKKPLPRRKKTRARD